MNVVITGSTGMVGKGVLIECLEHPKVTKVLVVNRTSLNIQHSKLEELLLSDFRNIYKYKNRLSDFDACFFCMGVSSLGLSEETYTKLTYNLTKAFADTLYELNKDMVFNYVSGSGTDSSENGATMWARVKGKTENYILNKGFKDAYAFRPGAIIPEKGISSKTRWYNAIYVILKPVFPLMKMSKNITTTTRLGVAMIHSVLKPITLKHLENVDINHLAK